MENIDLAKKLNIWATIISIAVIFLVVLMRSVKIDLGVDFSYLPAIYSTMNAMAAVFLIAALYFIRLKNIVMHRRMIFIALTSSFLFLLMYVLYHFTTKETTFCGVGGIRYVYFLILITHIILAATSFPFILFTFIRGYTMQVEKHKKMARWVYWVWLYVSISGPVVYLMLRPCMR